MSRFAPLHLTRRRLLPMSMPPQPPVMQLTGRSLPQPSMGVSALRSGRLLGRGLQRAGGRAAIARHSTDIEPDPLLGAAGSLMWNHAISLVSADQK